MHHVISPRPPIGGAVVSGVGLVLGLAGFVVAEATQQAAWAVIGGVLLLVGLGLTGLFVWQWRRGALTVDIDATGLVATAGGTRQAAGWDQIRAVTATDDELRFRRFGTSPALVVRLPSAPDRRAVAALTDDVAQHLADHHGAASPEPVAHEAGDE
ncbi:hypothetical protein ACQBAU_01450 [Propionibacteriaceae bacterium Y2011]|uniref:hypothetical protein n=1 Tax=Microlunatus sp. Y2014 TaxID=3418488 RepID=UPI003B4792B1